jgi:hypothetical protein
MTLLDFARGIGLQAAVLIMIAGSSGERPASSCCVADLNTPRRGRH